MVFRILYFSIATEIPVKHLFKAMAAHLAAICLVNQCIPGFWLSFAAKRKSGNPLIIKDFRLFSCGVEGGARTHDIQNHNLTL